MVEFPSKNKDDSEGSAGLLFMRTFNKWHGEVKRQLRALDLTHPQFVVLTSIGYLMRHERTVTQVMVARIAGMDVMSVSQIVNLLEKHTLILRREHPQDSRAKSVSLTPEGQERLKQALPVVEQIDMRFFGSLKEDEASFIQLLQRLSAFGF